MRLWRLRHCARALHGSARRLQIPATPPARRRLADDAARHISPDVELLKAGAAGAAQAARPGSARFAGVALKPAEHEWAPMDTDEVERMMRAEDERWGVDGEGEGEAGPSEPAGKPAPPRREAAGPRPDSPASRPPTSKPAPQRRVHLHHAVVHLHPTKLAFNRPSFGQAKAPMFTTLTYARLRDACPCPRCVHLTTRQKTLTSAQAYRLTERIGADLDALPHDFVGLAGDWAGATSAARAARDAARRPSDRSMVRTDALRGLGLRVRWPEPGGVHESIYPLDLIERLRHCAVTAALPSRFILDNLVGRRAWASPDQRMARGLFADWAELAVDKGALHRALVQLHRYGIVIVRGVPTDRTDDAGCALRAFVEALAGGVGLRNTFYGATWDVQNRKDSRNVAYTDLNLGLHMDLLYYSQPPRFQLLHCLRNRVAGGESWFVDAFAAAHDLGQRNAGAADALAAVPLLYEYDNDGRHLAAAHAVLPPAGTGWAERDAVVNWSPPFQAPSPALVPPPGTSPTEHELYAALAAFEDVLDEPRRRFTHRLEEGDMAVFDNRRVLHARHAFRDYTDGEREERVAQGRPLPREGEPSRWLKGGYMDGEVVWDRLVVLHKELWG